MRSVKHKIERNEMKRTIRQWWAAFAFALCWMGAAFGADIQYAANSDGGESPIKSGDDVASFAVPESQNRQTLTKVVPLTVAFPPIYYEADDVSYVYDGTGYSIDISVCQPSSGAEIKYAESENGPWQDDPIEYTDVCTKKRFTSRLRRMGMRL